MQVGDTVKVVTAFYGEYQAKIIEEFERESPLFEGTETMFKLDDGLVYKKSIGCEVGAKALPNWIGEIEDDS